MNDRDAMSGAHDCGGDAAAYVLGALEPAEAEAFRRHLEKCTVCRDEVEALEGVVHALPMAAPQHPVPRRLRRRVMLAIREEPKPWVRPWRGSFARWRLRPALMAAAVAIIAAVATTAGLELSGGRGTRVIQARVTGIGGSAELRLVGAHGELIVRRLTPPPAHHVYEVWLATPSGAASPAGVLFSVTSSGNADLGLPESLRGVSQVMVTPEPDGGSPTPTHAPVIVARLT